MNPQPRRSSRPAGSSSRAGVTTSEHRATVEPDSATSVCQPSGRSPGTSTVARPTTRPSTARGATHRSTWETSRRSPVSSSSTHTCTSAPSSTCTDTCGVPPSRSTTTGGSIRRHTSSSAFSSSTVTRSGLEASTPSDASTSIMVPALTHLWVPSKPQKSGTTP